MKLNDVLLAILPMPATVGVALMLVIGLASWKQVPLLLQVADNEPHSLMFSSQIGIVLLVLSFMCILALLVWVLIEFWEIAKKIRQRYGR